jgi:hypothetical protein
LAAAFPVHSQRHRLQVGAASANIGSKDVVADQHEHVQRHEKDRHHGEGNGHWDLRAELRDRQSAIQQQILVAGGKRGGQQIEAGQREGEGAGLRSFCIIDDSRG